MSDKHSQSEKGQITLEAYPIPSLAGGTEGMLADPDQQLHKKLSLASSIALGYICLATWIAFSGSIATALASGGANVLFWGLLLTLVCQLASVATLSECCSIWPEAGGQPVWTYHLSSTRMAPLLSYMVAWLVVVGLIFLGISAEAVMAQMVLAMVVLAKPTYAIERYHITLVMVASALASTLFGLFGAKILARSNKFSLIWSITGFMATCLTLLIKSKGKYNTPEFAFITIVNESGWSNNFVPWVLGLSQSAISTTAFDIVAHFAEEMENPARDAPIAMMSSVGINGVVGMIYAVVLIFTLPTDVTTLTTSATGFPFAQFMYDKTGSVPGAILFLVILLVPFFLTLADVNMAAARMILSFAREKGLPASDSLSKVNQALDAPVMATVLVFIGQVPLAFIFIGNSAAFNAIISVPTLALAISYAIVAWLMLFRGRPVMKLKAPFDLGHFWGPISNFICVLFTVCLTVFLSLPPVYPVTAANMSESREIGSFGFLMHKGRKGCWWGLSQSL
ncbi:amino acid transporter [Violaceomyces palustris]|uniref:Amino acid transporter n=1 Tax=Violaceomyces palustris TaxID=1673888 RepID=A0ACD0NTL5_9BASI|nr:amino acid transporter [Violaceomyces palustris]